MGGLCCANPTSLGTGTIYLLQHLFFLCPLNRDGTAGLQQFLSLRYFSAFEIPWGRHWGPGSKTLLITAAVLLQESIKKRCDISLRYGYLHVYSIFNCSKVTAGHNFCLIIPSDIVHNLAIRNIFPFLSSLFSWQEHHVFQFITHPCSLYCLGLNLTQFAMMQIITVMLSTIAFAIPVLFGVIFTSFLGFLVPWICVFMTFSILLTRRFCCSFQIILKSKHF